MNVGDFEYMSLANRRWHYAAAFNMPMCFTNNSFTFFSSCSPLIYVICCWWKSSLFFSLLFLNFICKRFFCFFKYFLRFISLYFFENNLIRNRSLFPNRSIAIFVWVFLKYFDFRKIVVFLVQLNVSLVTL